MSLKPMAIYLTAYTKETDQMKKYLLTGATGVLGNAVFQRLMAHKEQIILLIRARSQAHLVQRTKSLLAWHRLPETALSKILPIKSDLCQPKFGLTPNTYDLVLNQTTHIIHCAGNVTMNLPHETAKNQTMAITKNLVALMEQNKGIQKMDYASTVGVAGYTPQGIEEDWMENVPRQYRNSYEAAKALAENFLREKTNQGLNITVHRPSMVVGHSLTGRTNRFQVFYHLCEFLSGASTLGLIPNLKGMTLDIVPSDYVANLMVWASCQDRDLPRVLHACSGPGGNIDLNDLAEQVYAIYLKNGRSLVRPKQIPLPIYFFFVSVLKYCVPKPQRRSLNTLPLFLAYLKMPQYFINTNTRKLAGAAGINLPETSTYLMPVLEYYLNKNPG